MMKRLSHRTITFLAVGIGLTLVFADSGYCSAHRTTLLSGPAADRIRSDSRTPAIGLSLGFAMADFTGDTNPDVATVELSGFDAVSALYVVNIQLSEGGQQCLRVTAPFGGLLIATTDLTGDGNLDIVIRSARSHAPVAVFLNDGHGHFFAAELSIFTTVLRQEASEQKVATEHYYLNATLVFPRPNTISRPDGATRNPNTQEVSLVPGNRHVPSHPFLTFGLDRAPPTVA
jgi:hypothetical protein